MFSKYDVYVTVQFLYCYPKTDVLVNNLGIRDNSQLKIAEEKFTSARLFELAISPVRGYFTKTHLCNLHKAIFQDVYPFAGKYRREDIYKGQTRFMPFHMVESELNRLLAHLRKDNLLKGLSFDDFVVKLTYYMVELNVIHPFREGNGRTTREFIRMLADKNGYLIKWADVGQEELLDSVIESHYNIDRLKQVMYNLLVADE